MSRSRLLVGAIALCLVLSLAGLAQAALILDKNDPIYAVFAIPGSTASDFTRSSLNDHPINEAPPKCIDGNVDTKYLNFAKTNVGFIVVPAFGDSMLTSFRIATANDAPERDPLTISIEGTNDPFSTHLGVFNANWTSIYSGSTGLETWPGYKKWGSEIAIEPSDYFAYYRVLVTSIRGAGNSVQFSEIELNGVPVPEPGALTLLGLAVPALCARRRRA